MKTSISNKEVVLGVTGSIAAYKACDLASRLVELGVNVLPVLTRAAQEFVGAVSFEAITGRRAITGMFEPLQNTDVEHIAVAQRAHLFLVAPATANIIARAAHGVADDWLSTTLLATRAPILFAPAMNTAMYTHPATQANIELLRARGCHFVGPGVGRLACRTVGPGRMSEPAEILDAALPLLSGRTDLAGKRVLITSGATHEPIDPVRFLGNRSSGKMGRALALEALGRGAHVTVVYGPSSVDYPLNAELVEVETARQMADAVVECSRNADVIIGAAAVADYRPEQASQDKRKKTGSPLTLALTENPDILATVSRERRPGQVIVGFAAETRDVMENAKSKIAAKNLDLIVANLVGGDDAGFGMDALRAAIVDKRGNSADIGHIDKDALAERIMDQVVGLLRGSL
ncbi:MAG: bifunctional phosphopantothenoylcysteine decarboxylase/phosphopantothenate--cysteine ligase CoaBC [Candidatus Hydrogenedentes bacterium]|nr:bifunctional phosphopantothenoylcysteine decarboxylase/phosphopantothenate--cysteine ligase CoaBC [Candidatus Hydrogenedentota bacterium]